MRSISFRNLAGVVLAAVLVGGCERPPVDTVQQGYRGLGMVEVDNPRTQVKVAAANQSPAPQPAVQPGSPPASTVFKNVPVLGQLGVAEFTRLMVAMTEWVSPQQGCNYCHVEGDLASDALYTKVVARRMLQMTQHINDGAKDHVGATGVTCFTCHRGNPVPAEIWTADPGPKTARFAGNTAGQNTTGKAVGLTAMHYDPFSIFLAAKKDIRVTPTTALPEGSKASMQDTEASYSLMMHISNSLGVNCTFCHNSRSFAEWEAGSPQRTTAWHGIRMVRDLNASYLEPLGPAYPPARLGPLGDAPKVNCGTCHQGVSKPLYGASLLKDHPELSKAAAK